MAETTVDHDTIRKWAEGKGGKPAAVERTHHGEDDVGIIRLMFPKNAQSEHANLVEISWDEFFEQFEAGSLALLYDDHTLFNKLIGRDTAEKRGHGEHASRHHPAPAKADDAPPAKAKAAEKREAKPVAAEKAAAEPVTEDDAKSREYRDADGKVHHHTKAYMDSHKK